MFAVESPLFNVHGVRVLYVFYVLLTIIILKHVKRMNDIEVLLEAKIPACRESECLMKKLETVYFP